VLQEAAKELFVAESHRAFLIVIGVVPPSKLHLGFGDRDNPMVGDGDTMGITSQVLQDVVWSAKGWLGINDPVLLKQRAQETAEALFVSQRQTLAIEGELLGAKSTSQFGCEFATEYSAQDFHRKKEIGS